MTNIVIRSPYHIFSLVIGTQFKAGFIAENNSAPVNQIKRTRQDYKYTTALIILYLCAQVKDNQCSGHRKLNTVLWSGRLFIVLAVISAMLARWIVDNNKSGDMVADFTIGLSPCFVLFFSLRRYESTFMTLFWPWFTHSYQHHRVMASLRFNWQAIIWLDHSISFRPSIHPHSRSDKCSYYTWIRMRSITTVKVNSRIKFEWKSCTRILIFSFFIHQADVQLQYAY